METLVLNSTNTLELPSRELLVEIEKFEGCGCPFTLADRFADKFWKGKKVNQNAMRFLVELIVDWGVLEEVWGEPVNS